MKALAPSPHVMDDLHAPLAELGRRWAESPYRPRPTAQALSAWDDFLAVWLASDLPLVLRDGRNRGQTLLTASGRAIVFADNSPANWAFALALLGETPDFSAWTAETLSGHVPLTFLTKGPAAKRDLNKLGWKICHIDPVSDRRRYKRDQAPFDWISGEFMRLMSPRNMFLIPKAISGAGEIPDVIDAVTAFEREAQAKDNVLVRN
jgi:hypothetical protein